MARKVTDLTDGKRAGFILVVDEWDLSGWDIPDGGARPAGLSGGESFLFSWAMVAEAIGAGVGYDTPDANQEVDRTIEALIDDGGIGGWMAGERDTVLEMAMDAVSDSTGWCITNSHVEPPPE